MAGIIIGIFEGILLGFYYRNSKFIGILAICGAIGFGMGGIIGNMILTVLEIVLRIVVDGHNLIVELIVGLSAGIFPFMVTGLIGGAALGYGIYYIKKLSGK